MPMSCFYCRSENAEGALLCAACARDIGAQSRHDRLQHLATPTAARFRCDPAAVWLCRLSRPQGVSEWRLCIGVLHDRFERASDAHRDRYSRQSSDPSRALDRVARGDRVWRKYPARLRVGQHSRGPDLPGIAAGAGARRQAQRVCVSCCTASRSTRRRGAATASGAPHPGPDAHGRPAGRCRDYCHWIHLCGAEGDLT